MSFADVGGAPVAEPLPLTEHTKIVGLPSKWTDEYAKRVVRSDFAYSEAYRTHAHDWRYRNAAELYLAWAGQRYWDGTRVPRSSLGIYVIFEQVESMLPKLVSAICDPESYNFYAEDYDYALAWKELVLDQLNEINYRDHIRRACKSSLIYGNGILEMGYEDYEDESVTFEKTQRATRLKMMHHPVMGLAMVPDKIETNYSRSITKETKKRPYIRYRSLIDSYIDPNNETPWVQGGGYYILRTYMPASEVKALRSKKNFNIPDDATLVKYSHAKTTANQDVTKLSTELFRYNMWNPAQDYSGDPGQKRIEVLEYTTKERKVWMLNREDVIYNQPNRYGEINFWSMHYTDVLDRWHALAISDVAEGEQRLQQGILNARIDELALSIHRPMVKRRGVTIPAYQLKVRPGVVIETETPEGDIKQLEVQNITQQAFIEVEASERRTQRITGMSDLAALGSPTSGGNSANRTAAGINTQVGATQDRARYYVENAEALVIEPMLNTFIRYNKKFGDMKQAANWLVAHPQFKSKDPLAIMNAKVTAECFASVRMAAKGSFLQIFPQVAQVFFNPEMLQTLAKKKKTIDTEAFERSVMDALNYTPRMPWIVDMTPEELQAMQQPPPADKLKALLQQMEQQSNESIHDKANITKMLVQFLKDSMKHAGKLSELDDKELQHQRDTAKEMQLVQLGNGDGESETSD